MKTAKKYLLASALMAVAGASASAELIATGMADAGGTQIALDLVSDGQVSAFDFEIPLPEGVRNASLGNCVGELPSSHVGNCNISEGVLKVIVYSPTNEALPSTAVGTIFVPVPAQNLKLANIHGFSADGKAVTMKSMVDFQGKPDVERK